MPLYPRNKQWLPSQHLIASARWRLPEKAERNNVGFASKTSIIKAVWLTDKTANYFLRRTVFLFSWTFTIFQTHFFKNCCFPYWTCTRSCVLLTLKCTYTHRVKSHISRPRTQAVSEGTAFPAALCLRGTPPVKGLCLYNAHFWSHKRPRIGTCLSKHLLWKARCKINFPPWLECYIPILEKLEFK